MLDKLLSSHSPGSVGPARSSTVLEIISRSGQAISLGNSYMNGIAPMLWVAWTQADGIGCAIAEKIPRIMSAIECGYDHSSQK